MNRVVNWDDFSKDILEKTNSIAEEEMFNKSGQDLLDRFRDHDLGSFWMIEFRAEICRLLANDKEREAIDYAHRQVHLDK